MRLKRVSPPSLFWAVLGKVAETSVCDVVDAGREAGLAAGDKVTPTPEVETG
jgi:hypothetical protein